VSLAPTSDISLLRARGAVRARLHAQAAAHCERTAATARELAGRFGVDEDAAELAGLLHDWSREEPDAALLAYADTHGLSVLDEERRHPYLLHSRVAAEQLREDFLGIGLDVLSAVAAHTVGVVPMTALDKVVYIADAIEPERDYPGVERIRETAASCSLDSVFADAYASSVAFVLKKGGVLHPMTALVAAQVQRETGVSPLAPRERARS
jgi:predicted HD superfamily hydrolase involved in NAD metabolism